MERDDESGLSYHNARYYIPWLGRWMNPDPIGIGDGVNVYAYCKNDPVGNTDKKGTQIDIDKDAIKRSGGSTSVYNKYNKGIPVNVQKSTPAPGYTEQSINSGRLLAATGGAAGSNASSAGAAVIAKQAEAEKFNKEVSKALGIPESKPATESGGGTGSGNSNLFFGVLGFLGSLLMAATGVGLPFVMASMLYSADMIGAGVTQEVTGKETAPLLEQLPAKVGRDYLGMDKEAAKVFGSFAHAGIGLALGGGNFGRSQASFGTSTSSNYRATFFNAYPELKGKVVVHHAVEQQVLKRYPGVVAKSEMNSLENLRGIPNELNNSLHLGDIRRQWNQFYRTTPNPTNQQLLDKASEIDRLYGNLFNPKK